MKKLKFRADRAKKHKLANNLFIAAAAIIAGADAFAEIEMYEQRKCKWLIALNLLKKGTKAGIAARRKKTGWNNGYLL